MSILQQQASDVRIQEINLFQVITSASSAVACQLVVSKQGDTVNPKRFTSADDYLNEYGNPTASISFDVYCALDFFTEGNELWAKRIVGANAKYAAILFYATTPVGGVQTTALLPITGGVTDPTDLNWTALVPNSATDVALAVFYPNKGQGSYGNNTAISITSNNVAAPTNVALSTAATGGVLVSGAYAYRVSSVSGVGETLVSTQVTTTIAGSTNAITVSWDPVPLATGYRVYGRKVGSTEGFMVQVGQGTYSFIDTGAVSPDTTRKPITDPTLVPAPDPTFTVNVFDLSQSLNTAVEGFSCTLFPNTDDNGAATELTERINPFSQYVNVVSNVPSLITIPKVTSAARATAVGGDSGTAPTNFQIAGGYSVFSNKQLYAINTLINAGRGDPVVQKAMDTLVQARGDAIAVLDTPSNAQQWQQAINYRNLDLNLNSTYSALFNPDVQEADNINGKLQYVPFSGWAAALCARTDRVANPSFSIAGLNRGLVNVIKSRYTFDDGQSTAMFKAQVNYTRTFVGQGIALWEQQTLAAQQSALSWLSVRRIVNVIKTSLYQFLLYSLQEPNDDFTGRQIVGSCSTYLQAIQDARGITSFQVISDASNNTAAMFNSAIRRVTVIIVPTLPIHEIQLQVVISKQGVSFEEVLQQVSG